MLVACEEATVKRKCLVCGGSMEGKKPSAKTCSDACRVALHRKGPGPVATPNEATGPNYPIHLSDGVRENFCQAHDRVYREFSPPNLIGRWIGGCTECALEYAHRFELQDKVQSEARNIAKAVAAEMAELESEGQIKELVAEEYEAQSVELQRKIEENLRANLEDAIRIRIIGEIRERTMAGFRASSPELQREDALCRL